MDAFGVIDFNTMKTTLFMPKLDNYYKIWMTVLTTDEYKNKYNAIDEVLFVDQMEDYFKNL
jgi:hypothetical protein